MATAAFLFLVWALTFGLALRKSQAATRKYGYDLKTMDHILYGLMVSGLFLGIAGAAALLYHFVNHWLGIGLGIVVPLYWWFRINTPA